MYILPSTIHLVVLLLMAAGAACYAAQNVQQQREESGERLHSLPPYYGWYVLAWTILPAFGLWCLWVLSDSLWIRAALLESLPPAPQSLSDAEKALQLDRALRQGGAGQADWMVAIQGEYQAKLAISRWVLLAGVVAIAMLSAFYALRRVAPAFPAREKVETLLSRLLVVAAGVSILVTVAILFSVLFEAIRFFQLVPLTEFLFGTEWSPQAAIRADQGASIGSYGALPLFGGTLLITVIALAVAVPTGLLAAVYMSEYASPVLRRTAKPLLEILAGVPTVVYGYFAAIIIAPFIRDIGQSIGLDVASESALAAGLVMGIMIIPFVSSLSDDVINAVPQALRDASYGLGATQSETILRVILPAATPGIMGAILLAFSRAVGETMIVVMAAGLAANLTLNPLDSVTTVTAQIVALMVGDQAFDSPTTLAAFALGLTLFMLTLLLNFYALRIVNNYRRKYA